MFCQNCGKKIEDDANFCEFCGGKVSTATASAPVRTVSSHHPASEPYSYKKDGRRERSGKTNLPLSIGLVVLALAAAVLLWKGGVLDFGKGKGTPVVQSGSGPETQGSGGTAQPETRTPSGADLSTGERPTWEEFRWYLDDVQKNGVWKDAVQFTDFDQMLGSWKAYIVYDPYHNMDSYAEEILNVELTGSAAEAHAVMDWYIIYWGEEPYDVSTEEDSIFSGSYENGEWYLTGSGNIIISQFYIHEGKQYAFGSLLTPDGVIADLVLMRP